MTPLLQTEYVARPWLLFLHVGDPHVRVFLKVLESLFCLGKQVTRVFHWSKWRVLSKVAMGSSRQKWMLFWEEIICKWRMFFCHVWSSAGILFHLWMVHIGRQIFHPGSIRNRLVLYPRLFLALYDCFPTASAFYTFLWYRWAMLFFSTTIDLFSHTC